jgi:excisionase family DNA binding protein
MKDEHWLTVREVAGHLGIDVQTAYRWAGAGKLPALRLGTRRLRFRRADVEKALKPVGGKATRGRENGR